MSESFIGRVDAIFLPPDNSAAAAMPVIGRVARENKIPFYATSSTVLQHGALAAVSLDFIELGRESARLALEVLNGKDPKTMPIRLLENPAIYINAKLAAELNIDVSKLKHDPSVIIK